jgi:glycosyltransferase involved in cell wall biosynthesis
MKACMVAYSYYETDNRIRRYAETLAARGDDVSVVSLRSPTQDEYGELNKVKVYRIQERIIDEKGKLSYLKKLIRFFLKSGKLLTLEHIKNPYDLIHVHSVPDFEVFSTIFPKFGGAKVILDIHDLVPEFYRSKFGRDGGSMLFTGLKLVEKLSSSFADHVIISNHLWEKVLLSRSLPKDKCTTILNYADQAMFYRRNTSIEDGKIILLYPGTLNWHQGLDIAIKAFARIIGKAPQAEFHIYGDGPSKNELKDLISDLNMNGSVFLNGLVTLDEIPHIMSRSHIGIIPKRNDQFGGEAFSTKTFEFMSIGIPIIVSKTKIDQYYFNDSVVKFFEPENVDDLADAMLALINDRSKREGLAANGMDFAEKNSWETKKHIYLDLVDELCKNKVQG